MFIHKQNKKNTHTNKTNPPKYSDHQLSQAFPTAFNELKTTKFCNHLQLKVHFKSSSCCYLHTYTLTHHSIFNTTLIWQWKFRRIQDEQKFLRKQTVSLKFVMQTTNKKACLAFFFFNRWTQLSVKMLYFSLHGECGVWSHILLQWLRTESVVPTGGCAI